MASEVIGDNMHMDTRAFKVVDFKSEVVWRLPWPRRPLETICTWMPEYSRLLISNLRPYDLRGCLEAAMALEAIRVNVYMDTRVIRVADLKSEVK